MARDETEIYSYVASGVTSCIVMFVGWQLPIILGDSSLYLLFVLAITLNAWFGGLKTGLIVTIFSTVSAILFILFPHTKDPSFLLPTTFNITLFTLLGVLTSFIIEKYKRTDEVAECRNKAAH